MDLGDGIKIKVARIQSRRARRVLTRLYRPYENLRQSGRKVPESVQETITRQWLAEVLGRADVADDDPAAGEADAQIEAGLQRRRGFSE